MTLTHTTRSKRSSRVIGDKCATNPNWSRNHTGREPWRTFYTALSHIYVRPSSPRSIRRQSFCARERRVSSSHTFEFRRWRWRRRRPVATTQLDDLVTESACRGQFLQCLVDAATFVRLVKLICQNREFSRMDVCAWAVVRRFRMWRRLHWW